MRRVDTREMPAPMQLAYKTLPERLYRIRRERGLTQLEVELETGICKVTISQYESGVRYPIFLNLLKLATFYEVKVGWLLGEEG